MFTLYVIKLKDFIENKAMKRFLDLTLSFFGLVILLPILVPVAILVWIQDWHSPFYIAPRIGKGGKPFNMVKLRSMVVNADRSGVDSTGSNDRRITGVGHFIRKCKLDEITQLWNVLIGDMSLVGPRPNVKRETDLYTGVESRLLSVVPGITDFSSIVFSDEGDILRDFADPDIAYNQLIRPWKSRLGLFYIDRQTVLIDLKLCFLTACNSISRGNTLKIIAHMISSLGGDNALIDVASRRKPLVPFPPPGSDRVITSRDGDPNKI
jgi:lipopolysaccharide/colanic/teichoic acid biosynthesis glycosyltransferase